MPRNPKATGTITGISKDPDNKLIVQKSTPLLSLWRSDMSLAEFKILDSYLSRINSHQPAERTVTFTKGELEQLLGVKKINKPDLAARLKSLGRFVELEDQNPGKTHQIALFEEAYGELDENGQWVVQLTCTEKAMKYIFNIETLGYLRYKLRCITSLTSRYTYILFLYLEKNRFRKTWEVSVDDLREYLNCDKDESYAAFKVFNDRILKRCRKELLEKTECRFTYEPVKAGRRVTAIRFTLETLADGIEPATPDQEPADPNQLSLFDSADTSFAELEQHLTPEEIAALTEQILQKVPALDQDSAQQQLHQLILDMLATESRTKKQIRNKARYLSTMIERNKIVPAAASSTETAGEFVPGEMELASMRNLKKIRDSLVSDEEVQP